MAYFIRSRTSGTAQALYNDLLANLANLQHYEDYSEYMADNELATSLAAWLLSEKAREA